MPFAHTPTPIVVVVVAVAAAICRKGRARYTGKCKAKNFAKSSKWIRGKYLNANYFKLFHVDFPVRGAAARKAYVLCRAQPNSHRQSPSANYTCIPTIFQAMCLLCVCLYASQKSDYKQWILKFCENKKWKKQCALCAVQLSCYSSNGI